MRKFGGSRFDSRGDGGFCSGPTDRNADDHVVGNRNPHHPYSFCYPHTHTDGHTLPAVRDANSDRYFDGNANQHAYAYADVLVWWNGNSDHDADSDESGVCNGNADPHTDEGGAYGNVDVYMFAADGNNVPDPDGDANGNFHTNVHIGANKHADADINTPGDEYTDGDSYIDKVPNTPKYPNGDVDEHPDADTNVHIGADEHADADVNTYQHTEADGYSNVNSDGYLDTVSAIGANLYGGTAMVWGRRFVPCLDDHQCHGWGSSVHVQPRSDGESYSITVW